MYGYSRGRVRAMAYPQPPPLVTKYVDAILRENSRLLSAAKAFEDAGRLHESARCVRCKARTQ